jgi:hypothetical protein
MKSWIDAINWSAARFSAPPLPRPVSSEVKDKIVFKPILPTNPAKLTLIEQTETIQRLFNDLQRELNETGSRRTERGLSRKRVKEFVTCEQQINNEVRNNFILNEQTVTLIECF